MKKIKINKKMIGILSGTFILSSISLNGCNKKIDCDIEIEHAHKYISTEGFSTYKISEYEIQDKLFRQNEYLKITSEIELMNQFNLLKIEDNIDSIIEDTSNDLPHIEYEYQYRYSITQIISGIPITSWYNANGFTTDSHHANLTGNIYDIDYQYKAYKIITDEEGNPHLQESEPVDDLLSIKNNYPYFKLDDYKIKIYSDKYKLKKTKEKIKTIIR